MTRREFKAVAIVGTVTALGIVLAAACGGEEFTSDAAGTATGTGTTTATGAGGATSSVSTGTMTTTGTNAGGGGAGQGGQGGTGGMACLDVDGDSVTDCEGDCDDNDVTVFPGAPEICGDAKDNDCANGVDDGCQGLGTYVANDGDDANPGTQAMPVQTIAVGIQHAVTIGNGVDVYVAQGHYPETVALIEGISIFGGYLEDPNGWVRDPAMYDTGILCPSSPCITAGDSITRATAFSGFRVEGHSGDGNVAPGSVAVLVAGGSPTFAQNKIHGGDVPGGVNGARASIGVFVNAPTPAPGPLLAGNEIDGGDSIGESIAVLIDVVPWQAATFAAAEITNNRMTSGNALNSWVITDWASAPGTKIQSNIILAGTSVPGVGSIGEAWGIVVGTVDPDIDGNSINFPQQDVGTCVQPANWCGGIKSFSSSAKITNNVIFGNLSPKATAVWLLENEGPAGPVVVNGNYLDPYGQGGGQITISAAIVTRNAFTGVNSIVGRVRNNILQGGKANLKYGVYEDTNLGAPAKTSRPEFLENNDFAFMPGNGSAYYHQWNGGAAVDIFTLALVNALPGAANNVEGDPQVDGTFHLTNGSSVVIDMGTPTDAAPKDMDGDNRPQGNGVDIGPDEHQ